MITKDLGLVTAYAYAVSGGYTGTEAEFTELLGNIAKDLEEIENLTVTVETLPPGSEATASYSDGVLNLGIPRGDKGDKGDTGETGPQGPKGDPGDVSTEQLDEAISGLRTEMEENYARNDGYYEEMTVGDAEQLISTQFVEDSDPYLFRPTGGSADVDNREYVDKIVGGTVAWNQLMDSNDWRTQTVGGITFTNNGDGTYTINGTATGNTFVTELKPFINGHVYFLSGCPKGGSRSTYFLDTGANIGGSDLGNGFIGRRAYNTGNYYVRMYAMEGTTVNNLKVVPQLIDLTQVFGSVIADYIYSLEQAHAGDGVAWFRQYFPKDYYPYDPGTLRSVEGVSAHETVGFNQWDEEWVNGYYNQYGMFTAASGYVASNKIKLLPDTAYFISSQSGELGRICLYDVNENFTRTFSGFSPSTQYAFRTSSKECYVAFDTKSAYGAVYKNDICINLSNPTRNGEYEPYVKHTYPLDSSLTLRGVPKLVDGKLSFDGDVYPPSGEVQRRYGLRAYQNGDESLADAITDGTNTVYKLATPTTETAEGYEHYQICDPSGTEEFVTTGIVPVGHETRYPTNLRDKLQHLPDLPSPLLDGAYMVMVNGSQMHLERLLIPDAPTEDGTYTLKVTVSGGNPTYTWEVEA